MNKNMAGIAILTIGAGLFGYIVLPAALQVPEYKNLFGLVLPMIVTAVATMWFLLSSLNDLAPTSRKAYRAIAVGILLLALAQIVQVVAILTSVVAPAIATSMLAGIVTLLLIVLAASYLYAGVRRLALLLSIKTIWGSPLFMGIFSAAIACLTPFLPYAQQQTPSPAIVVVFCLMTFSGSVLVAATAVALRIASVISSFYRSAMMWLAAGLATAAAGIYQEVVAKYTDLLTTPYVTESYDTVLFLIAALLLMKAGYAFRLATFKRLASDATYIEAVMYAAGMVSKPVEIDPILDRLRAITAKLPESSSLSDDQKRSIMQVYLDIERYLETQEPLRRITRSSLRERMTSEFVAALIQYEQR